MRVKLTDDVRPEFQLLIMNFRTLKALADWLGNGMTPTNMAQCKCRGYLPVKYAKIAERKSRHKYSAKLLAKEGEL